MKARQREPSSRLYRVASISGSVAPRPMRRPLRRAAMTLLSLTTRQSPGCRRSGRSVIFRSSYAGVFPGFTTRSRAASRGLAGRSAMRSGGNSKSKRSVRIASCPLPQGRGFGKTLSPHRRLDDLVGVLDRLAALDLVDVFHAFDHLAPYRVLVVEEAGVAEADEKLAVAGIRVGGARHRHRAAHVRFLVEFGFEFFARAASAGALRAAGLRHEPVDHPVKYDPVVEPVLHQFLDARDVPGREFGTHLDHHIALGGLESQRVFRLGHFTLLTLRVGGGNELALDRGFLDVIETRKILRQIGIAFILEPALVGAAATWRTLAVLRVDRVDHVHAG